MRILFDHQIFALQKYGGISRYFYELINGLKNSNLEVLVSSGFNKNRYIQSLPNTVNKGVYLQSYPPKTTKLIKSMNRVYDSYYSHKFSPQIIHETYYSPHRSCLGKAKRVLTVYDMIHERFPEFFSSSDQTRRNKKISINRADHVICISESTKNDLINILGVDETRISVVHLAPTTFEAIDNDYLQRRDNFRRPYLLYVGVRRGHKNFKKFIDAISLSPELRAEVDIVCFGGGEFTEEEKAQFKLLGLFEGSISQIDGSDQLLQQFYANATAFVYPSVYEGFGLPPIEAMRAKCPVICSNSSSLPEVVGEAAVMFDPLDVEEITKAILKVVFDDRYRKKLIKLGSMQAEKFSWDNCVEHTLNIYRKLI